MLLPPEPILERIWKRPEKAGLLSHMIMGRSEWLTVAITLLSVWFTWYAGQSKAVVICGGAGALILFVLVFLKRGKKRSNMASKSVQQTVNPIVTQTANPTINVNVGSPSPSQPSGARVDPPKVRSNIRFVEVKPVMIHGDDGKLYESPQGLGDFRVTVACFRNEAIVGQTIKQPSIKAHIIFRDSTGREVADVATGVWLQEYKDAVTFTVGTKQCLILFLLTSQGSLKRLWKESYTTEHSWMSAPQFRVGDDVIPARIASVEVALVEAITGTCLLQSIFNVEYCVDGQLPGLVLSTVSPI